ncbi:MAG: radical SAM protein [Erysipelotrichales bacterium]|nr:radical SAM protein [Erysipelotrichales bacterium]
MKYVPSKTIITKVKNSSWFGVDYNMNIYRGCNHGCIYCDSRSSCYQEENFDEVKAKEDALTIIKKDLTKLVNRGVIGTGAMSDPYNNFEEKLNLTGNSLLLLDAYRFGVAVTTKSPLIVRDIDLYQNIAQHSPVICKFTITCADDELSSLIETNVAVSSERFKAIKELSKAGIFSGVQLTPLLPFINDNAENVRRIVKMAADSGAKFVFPSFLVTLRDNQRKHYYKALDNIFPGLKDKYMKRYGNRYLCAPSNLKKLNDVLAKECVKHNLLYKMNDIIKAYKKPYNLDILEIAKMLKN